MYERAGIDTKYLKKDYGYDNASIASRRACLAYLTIDILRSPDKNINTAARARALELLYDLNLDAVASAFAKFSFGFVLPYSAKEEPVEDLIPRCFMQRSEEKGGTPHNTLFFKNAKIQEIFEIRQQGYGDISSRMDLDGGVSKLLHKHPTETVQILISMLRMYGTDCQMQELVFRTLVGLSQLDPIQKGELFGVKASYRSDSQHGGLSGMQSRIGATTGAGAGFGDDRLDLLSAEQLRARLRQTNTYLQLLEEKLAGTAQQTAPGNAAPFADPDEYSKVLGLDPRTGPADFQLLLTACYRTVARTRHPDKTGGNSTGEFQKLQEAYEKLSDQEFRRRYLAGGRR